MDDYLERLLKEETELNEKKAKLSAFIQSGKLADIDREQQSLLIVQLNAMATYSECLNQRVILINNKAAT